MAFSVDSFNGFSVYCTDLIWIPRNRHLPVHLDVYARPMILDPTERQNRATVCLKAIYTTACHFECNSARLVAFRSTARSLVTLRHGNTPSVAYYAICITVRLAYHLQCDIMHNDNNGRYSYLALRALQVLDDLDDPAKSTLQRELSL
jgi:hypothetical protein